MGNFGHSTIIVEGANAKKVYDFLLEIAKNTPYKYDIKPLRIGFHPILSDCKRRNPQNSAGFEP